MPITITLPLPGSPVGPGLRTHFQSDFVGPFPVPHEWRVWIGTDPEGTHLVMGERASFPDHIWDHQWLTQTGTTNLLGDSMVEVGAQVYVFAEVTDSAGTVIDSGRTETTVPWEPTVGLGQQAFLLPRSVTGGFTESDRTMLEQTNDLAEQLLTLSNVIESAVMTTVATTSGAVTTPISDFFRWIQHELFDDRELSAETCERIDADIGGGNYFSVTLRITQFPPEWRFQTPDMAWGFHDLAVLTFWSGDTMLARHGVHALQHTVQPLPGTVWWGGPIAQAPLQWGSYHITVDWAEGVCGRLTGQHWPL